MITYCPPKYISLLKSRTSVHYFLTPQYFQPFLFHQKKISSSFKFNVMIALGTLSLIIHIVAGVLTLLAGPVAIFTNRKYVKAHKIAGNVFFYAMLVVCVSAVFGFLKRPDQVFFQFLLGIAILVFAGIMRGIRALQIMKTFKSEQIDFAYTGLLAFSALWMIGMSAWHFTQGTMIAFPILFSVFGISSALDAFKNVRMFTNPLNFERIEWLKLHVGSMLGAFTASTTAFTVNAAPFLPWYFQWFGPTLLMLPLQIYWGRKLKSSSEKKKIALA
jgi:Predicted membrane protein (DUF2306)